VAGTDNPKRGDVIVFRFPGDPSVNYIKRVIGAPGDHVVYKGKRLYINGKLMEQTERRPYFSPHIDGTPGDFQRITEIIDNNRHDILNAGQGNESFLEFDVPSGHYFVMGHN